MADFNGEYGYLGDDYEYDYGDDNLSCGCCSCCGCMCVDDDCEECGEYTWNCECDYI